MKTSDIPSSADRVDVSIEALMAALTLDEKIRIIQGDGTFTVAGVPRLGIEELLLSDGPHGVRQEMQYDSFVPVGNCDDASTYLPVGIALAATWNLERATDFGDVLGGETRARGKDVILGPGVNLIRTPLCGRNFEYFSEDPLHAGLMGVAVIKAIQAHDVAACVKHYACNNQELNRHGVDVQIDERTLRELYLPAFEMAVKDAQCLTVMGAYNLLNGTHCCHHDVLLQTILKEEWGFAGLVVSDWSGVHDADQAARPGLDLEMSGRPHTHYLRTPFKEGLESGKYPMQWLDEKVRRVLYVHQQLGKLGKRGPRAQGQRLTPKHRRIAKAIADEALVLLKNDRNLLPLDPNQLRTVAVIGDNATRTHASGGGSSGIRADYEITPLEGLREALGPNVQLLHVKGYPVEVDGVEQIPVECLGVADQAGIRGWLCQTYDNRSAAGEPCNHAVVPEVFAESGTAPDNRETGYWMQTFSTTVTPAVSGRYTLVVRGGDYFSLTWDGRSLISVWDLTDSSTETVDVELTAGRSYEVKLVYRPKVNVLGFSFGWIVPGKANSGTVDPFAEAEAAARAADVVLIFGGCSHRQDTEGVDRGSMQLPGGQNDLIARVAQVNPRCAVVLFGGSAVELPWLASVPAVVQAWYPGQEGGRALAHLLLGDINPSGRLPFSWPKHLQDVAAHAIGDYGPHKITYRDALNLGYRWHDGEGPDPLFPFGFGLSYSTFKARIEQVDCSDSESLKVQAKVTNTGNRAGATVLQCYMTLPNGTTVHPPKKLVGFCKIHLQVDESQIAEITIPVRNRSYYDVGARRWVAPSGDHQLHLAWHANDIIETRAVSLQSENA